MTASRGDSARSEQEKSREEQEPEWQQVAPVLQGTELLGDVTNCRGNESLAFLPSPGDRCMALVKPGWGAGELGMQAVAWLHPACQAASGHRAADSLGVGGGMPP